MTLPLGKLAIVGASARAAAFSAIRAGYEVITADLFADADLARVAGATRINHYPEALVDWLAACDCDAWMYTGALENYPDYVDRLAAARPLLGNSGAALSGVRDPFQLQAICREAGVAFPDTRPTADGLPIDGSWLCKTYRGANGSGVWRLDGGPSLERAHQAHGVFQRFIAGTPAAAIFVLGCDRAWLAGVTHQSIRRGGAQLWQYAGSWGPLRLAPAVAEHLQAFAQLLERRQLRGIVGVDLVIDEQDAWVIEVNPRYTASVEIVERFSSASLASAHVAACTGNSSRLAAATSSNTGLLAPGAMQYGKSVVYARCDVRITSIAFDWMMRQAAFDPVRCALADIPHAGEVIAAGRPVLTVFAEGVAPGDLKSRLTARVAEVERQLYDV